MTSSSDPAPAPPAAGDRLGRYTLDQLLGQGGFAWVYAATRDDDKSFAVKVLKPRYATDTAFESRFRQEAAFAASLVHPNIIHIEEVADTTPGAAPPFFAMDLYPDTLSERLARDTALPEADVVTIAIGISEALAFAHAQNVVHRDIKPDNILLAADQRAVLTDFGIARAVSNYVAATGYTMTIGTPAYISPEQAQGRAVDGRSDLYSLGITLYRSLTGEVPFRSRDWFELARMHVEDQPEQLHKRRPDVTRRVERIILRLLAKHPDDRYPSAAALLEDLHDIAARTRSTDDIPIPEAYGRDSKSVEKEKKSWWKRLGG
jgi:eukaryotic-like serine/threonine-protein kinase